MKEHIRKSLLHALDMWEIHDLKLFSCFSISHVQVGMTQMKTVLVRTFTSVVWDHQGSASSCKSANGVGLRILWRLRCFPTSRGPTPIWIHSGGSYFPSSINFLMVLLCLTRIIAYQSMWTNNCNQSRMNETWLDCSTPKEVFWCTGLLDSKCISCRWSIPAPGWVFERQWEAWIQPEVGGWIGGCFMDYRWV